MKSHIAEAATIAEAEYGSSHYPINELLLISITNNYNINEDIRNGIEAM